MPDNWGFVFAAYGLTAVVLTLYWRHLVRKEKELQRQAGSARIVAGSARDVTGSARNVAGSATAHTERPRESSTADPEIAERSRQPSRPGHPRSDPSTRGPLQQ